MRWHMEDNITECIESSDSIESDVIDDYVGNLGRIFTHADSTEVNPELWETYKKLNKLEIYPHMFFKTARSWRFIRTCSSRRHVSSTTFILKVCV